MRPPTPFIRIFLRGICWDAEDRGISFAEAIKIASRAKLTDSLKGKVLTGTTSGGTSVAFSLPPLGTLAADDIAEACSVLLDQYDEIVAQKPDIADKELLAQLLDRLRPVRSFSPIFRGLRR